MTSIASNMIILVVSIIIILLSTTTTTTSAFNITRLLNNHPDFSTFNDLLTQTGVAAAINSRQTITVLVVANADIGPLTSKPQATARNILATHVVLDYYDTTKLGDMSKGTALLTTLFQASGVADRQQGFLNVTTSGGKVVFGSAVKGAPHDSKMVASVAAQPFNISVIQISQPIIAPGLDQNAPVSPSTSPKTSPPVAAPPPKKAAGKVPTPAPSADAPADDEAADAPDTEGPAGPAAGGPSPAPGPQEADADDSETPAKLAAAPKGAAARPVAVGGAMVAAFMALVTLAL